MKARVLLIDDEELLLLGWKYTLESAGHQVMTASSGRKALDIVEAERPDIVITDLFIPGMTGIEICKKIKKVYPETKVVLTSGDPFELERIEKDFIEAGGRCGYLKKPMTRDEILDAIDKILKE